MGPKEQKYIYIAIIFFLLLPVFFMIWYSSHQYWILYHTHESLFWLSIMNSIFCCVILAFVLHITNKKYNLGRCIYNNSIYILYSWFLIYLIVELLHLKKDPQVIIAILNFPFVGFTLVLIPLCVINYYLSTLKVSSVSLSQLEAYNSIHDALHNSNISETDIEGFSKDNHPVKIYLLKHSYRYLQEIKENITHKRTNKLKYLLRFIKTFENTEIFEKVLLVLEEQVDHYSNLEVIPIIIYKSIELNDVYLQWCVSIFEKTSSQQVRDALGNLLVQKFPNRIIHELRECIYNDVDIFSEEGTFLILGGIINSSNKELVVELIDNIYKLKAVKQDLLLQTVFESSDNELLDPIIRNFIDYPENIKHYIWKNIHLSDYAVKHLIKKHTNIEFFVEGYLNNPHLSDKK